MIAANAMNDWVDETHNLVSDSRLSSESKNSCCVFTFGDSNLSMADLTIALPLREPFLMLRCDPIGE